MIGYNTYYVAEEVYWRWRRHTGNKKITLKLHIKINQINKKKPLVFFPEPKSRTLGIVPISDDVYLDCAVRDVFQLPLNSNFKPAPNLPTTDNSQGPFTDMD